jgi:hypothetical protein
MYCVCCGEGLSEANRLGLTCQRCRQSRREHRIVGQDITVNYCYNCGGLYSPCDASIEHLACIAAPTGRIS